MRPAQINNTWRYCGRCYGQKLAELYNIVKNIFDFYEVSNRRIKYKPFEQHIWDTIFWKLNKNKHQLVG